MAEVKPCPFCNKNLIHTNGKKVNRHYKGEPTVYRHLPEGCILDGLQITEKTLERWNTRITLNEKAVANALERATPKPPKDDGWLYCPVCGKDVCVDKPNYCSNCGQCIDWGWCE